MTRITIERSMVEQALEAAAVVEKTKGYFDERGSVTVPFPHLREMAAAMDALRAALEQPEQEPVAWRLQRSDGQYELYFLEAAAERAAECYLKRPPVEPLYTAPTPRKPLTDDEIKREKPVCADFVSFRAGIRCMERIIRKGK